MYILYGSNRDNNRYVINAEFFRIPNEKQPNIIEFFNAEWSNGECKTFESVAHVNTDNLIFWTKDTKKARYLD